MEEINVKLIFFFFLHHSSVEINHQIFLFIFFKACDTKYTISFGEFMIKLRN